MKFIFDYKFRFYTSKMNEICLHCHLFYFSSIILSFGQCGSDDQFLIIFTFRPSAASAFITELSMWSSMQSFWVFASSILALGAGPKSVLALIFFPFPLLWESSFSVILRKSFCQRWREICWTNQSFIACLIGHILLQPFSKRDLAMLDF